MVSPLMVFGLTDEGIDDLTFMPKLSSLPGGSTLPIGGPPHYGVALYDTGGNIIGTAITDSNGDYSFPAVPNGNYQVGVTDTDGIEATGQALPGHPSGLLVVQDGNFGGLLGRQSFKLVDWGTVLEAIEAG